MTFNVTIWVKILCENFIKEKRLLEFVSELESLRERMR